MAAEDMDKHIAEAALDPRSFHLDMIFAFAEIVAGGCKPLALSPPLTAFQLEQVAVQTRAMAEDFGILLEVDNDFPVTRLFDAAFTAGKSVIVIAASHDVLAEYRRVKELKAASLQAGEPADLEDQVARRLGALLGYRDEAVDRLLMNHQGRA